MSASVDTPMAVTRAAARVAKMTAPASNMKDANRMARFNVYAQRIQTREWHIEADSYEEAKRKAVQFPDSDLVFDESAAWSYDVDEMGSLG